MSTPRDMLDRLPTSIIANGDDSEVAKLWTVIHSEIATFEEALAQVLTIVSIDDSEGLQLDNLGVTLRESRQDRNDVDYRTALKIAVVKLTSIGSVPVLNEISNFILGPSEFIRVNELHAGVSERVWDGNGVMAGKNLMDGRRSAGDSGSLEIVTKPFAYSEFSSDFSIDFQVGDLPKTAALAQLNKELPDIRAAGVDAVAMQEDQ